jgi:uncharacterized protein YjbI with pentapeptide repeats
MIWPGWAYGWDWTGLGASFSPPRNAQGLRDYYPGKTLWDWLQLLIVPLAVVGAAGWLNLVQQRRAEASEAQRERDEAKRDDRREQESILDALLDKAAGLLLHEDLSAPGAEKARQVARGYTLTALRRLDGPHKGIALRFLSDAQLLPVIDLSRADLRTVDLSRADLSRADLREAILVDALLAGANLCHATLQGANLSSAILSAALLAEADLSKADLRNAELHGADLREANLYRANLRGAHFTSAEQLAQARSLEGATMPDGTVHA